ncbi:MAG: hypothetical protein MJ033_03045 [Victivallaceae bacterium]|nr:hypothetical protein [Victivallaceae bacterium]
MELVQLKLLIDCDDITSLLEKYSASLPENLKIDSITCSEEKITVVGEISNCDFTLEIGTVINENENSLGLVIKNCSLSHPDDPLWKSPWNGIKSVFSGAFSVVHGWVNLDSGFQSIEEFTAKKIAEKIGASADDDTIYFEPDSLLEKLPLPLNISGNITRFDFTENGIELVIGDTSDDIAIVD